jgi:hypothetical protein
LTLSAPYAFLLGLFWRAVLGELLTRLFFGGGRRSLFRRSNACLSTACDGRRIGWLTAYVERCGSRSRKQAAVVSYSGRLVRPVLIPPTGHLECASPQGAQPGDAGRSPAEPLRTSFRHRTV